MSSFIAQYASIDEAWGKNAGSLTAGLPSNPYTDPEYQRQVLNTSMDTAIRPREPQTLSPSDVRAYLEQLQKDSGPRAVAALLPPDFVRRLTATMPQEAAKGKFQLEDIWDALTDPENVFFVLVAAFAALVVADSLK